MVEREKLINFLKKYNELEELVRQFGYDYLTFLYGTRAADIGIDELEFNIDNGTIDMHCFETFDGGETFWIQPQIADFVDWNSNRGRKLNL